MERAQQEAVEGGQNKHADVWAEGAASRCKDPPRGWGWRPRPVWKELES